MNINNIFIDDKKEKIKFYKSNKIFKKISSEFENIDSISNYNEFKLEVQEYKKFTNNFSRTVVFAQYGGEGVLYGHRNAFFDYAGCGEYKNQNFLLPYFEHGINFQEQDLKSILQSSLHNFVYQGTYKRERMNKRRQFLPVFPIGPYVSYAKPYYSSEQHNTMKKKLGKTILLYPLHTCEGAIVNFDRSAFVKKIMDKFKNDYNTIMISVYWNDVDDPLYEQFEAEGAMLVSAGYRSDPNFISRVRTIIELADATGGNSVGTHIGYCMALGKPHVIFDVDVVAEESFRVLSETEKLKFQENNEKIYKAFANLAPSNEEQLLRDEIFEVFWGGKTCFKTPSEAKSIIDISQKLVRASHGNSKTIMNIVELAVKEKKTKVEFTDQELFILKKSVGFCR